MNSNQSKRKKSWRPSLRCGTKTVFHQIQNRLEQLLHPDEVANDKPDYKHLLASIKTSTLQVRQMATAIKAFHIGVPLLSEVNNTLAERVLKNAS